MWKRIIALALILVMASVAWLILALSMHLRTQEAENTVSDAVGGLWGTAHAQLAPVAWANWETEKKVEMSETEKLEYLKRKLEEENLREKMGQPRSPKAKGSNEEFLKLAKESHQEIIPLGSSDIQVSLDLDYRKKGLLWFSTYQVAFAADYQVENPIDHSVIVQMVFPFSSARAVYDNMKVEAPGQTELKYYVEANADRRGNQMVAQFPLGAKASQTVKFSYESRGLDQWSYQFGSNTEMVKNFKLRMLTNFDAIDFPRDSISPDEKHPRATPPGWDLLWQKQSIVSAFQIGMVMSEPLNPGPLASAMSRHAPVSLLFFFFVIFLLQIMRGIKIHPMNYFFLAASFFSFDLLFSYLVDHVDLKLAFAVSSAVSIFLVVSYLRLVVGSRFALVEAGISQLVFQILFSLAHFFKNYTGLTITIGAILTLAVVMRLTAKVDWEQVFRDKDWGKMSNPRKKEHQETSPEMEILPDNKA